MIVTARGLRKSYGTTEALRGVDLAWDGPQIIGILGPNGAGKTTLLDLLTGLTEPTEGCIELFDRPRLPYPRRRVGVVLQKEFALDGIRVGEYAELFAAIQGVSDGRARILAQARLEDRDRVSLASVSGGEAQRLFIAAAAVHQPDLLFLDEPSAHLDPSSKQDLAAMLRHLRCTVVMTTHDLHEAESLCDYVVFLVEGAIKAQGPRDVLTAGSSLEQVFFDVCAVRIGRRGEQE